MKTSTDRRVMCVQGDRLLASGAAGGYYAVHFALQQPTLYLDTVSTGTNGHGTYHGPGLLWHVQ